LYVANLINNNDEEERKVIEVAMADNKIGSRHVEKGICKNVRERTAERLARASKMTQERTTPTIYRNGKSHVIAERPMGI
jgi:hypothetical protein